jgi:hypothetical protein
MMRSSGVVCRDLSSPFPPRMFTRPLGEAVRAPARQDVHQCVTFKIHQDTAPSPTCTNSLFLWRISASAARVTPKKAEERSGLR